MSVNMFVAICPDLSLEDGTLEYHPPSTVHLPGDYVVADCKYSLALKGPEIRKCQSNGRWSGYDARCEESN